MMTINKSSEGDDDDFTDDGYELDDVDYEYC